MDGTSDSDGSVRGGFVVAAEDPRSPDAAELIRRLAELRPDVDDPAPGSPGARSRTWRKTEPEFAGVSEFFPDEVAHAINLGRDTAAFRARRAHTVRVAAIDLDLAFDRGEELRTEISAKFTRERIESDLGAAGLELVEWMTDPEGLFALSLSRTAPGAAPPA